jgi:hypothetical protein
MNKEVIKKTLDKLIYEKIKDAQFLKMQEWRVYIHFIDIYDENIIHIPRTDMNERWINECVNEYQELNGCFHFVFDPEDDWYLMIEKRAPLLSLFNGRQIETIYKNV